MSTMINNVNSGQQCQKWSQKWSQLPLQESFSLRRHTSQSPSASPSQSSEPVRVNFNIFYILKHVCLFFIMSMLLLVNPPKILKLFLQAFTMRWVYAFSLMSTLRTLPPGFTGRSSPETFTLWVLSTKVTTL